MPAVTRRLSPNPDKISFGITKKNVRISTVPVKRPSTVDDGKSTISAVQSPAASALRKPSSDFRKSNVSTGRQSAKENEQVGREFRFSKAADSIRGTIRVVPKDEPVAFSYYSFSDTDTVKDDEDRHQVGPVKLSSIAIANKATHKLAKRSRTVKRKKSTKDSVEVKEVMSAKSFSTNPTIIIPKARTSLTDELHNEEEQKKRLQLGKSAYEDDSDDKEDLSEEFEIPSEESRASDFRFDDIPTLNFDFFETLGELPSIDKISLDSSLKKSDHKRSKHSTKSKSKSVLGEDSGNFVDPLSGTFLYSSSSSESSSAESGGPSKLRLAKKRSGADFDDIPEEEEEEGEEEEEPFIPTESSEDNDLLQTVGEDDEIEDEEEAPQTDIAMEIYLYQKKKVQIEEALQLAAKTMETQEVKALKENVADFLEQIVKKVVYKVEAVRPKVLLRRTLDKKALMEELMSKLAELDVEQKARLFLNRKVVEYYRRKNNIRHIVADASDMMQETLGRYNETLTRLDVALSREEKLKDLVVLKIDKYKEILKETEAMEQKSHNNFDALLRNTLLRENSSPYLKHCIGNLLQKMNDVREEISETRYRLIERQHLLAKLAQQIEAMENIGGGYTIRDYENLQAEITILDKKVEERNIDLNKLRNYTTSNLHMITHVKEQHKMLRNTIAVKQTCLNDLLDEKAEMREGISLAQKKRKKIRKEIGHVIFQGGLHDKPELMADYDDTVQRIEIAKKRVEQLKKKAGFFVSRITLLESKYSMKSLSKASAAEIANDDREFLQRTVSYGSSK